MTLKQRSVGHFGLVQINIKPTVRYKNTESCFVTKIIEKSHLLFTFTPKKEDTQYCSELRRVHSYFIEELAIFNKKLNNTKLEWTWSFKHQKPLIKIVIFWSNKYWNPTPKSHRTYIKNNQPLPHTIVKICMSSCIHTCKVTFTSVGVRFITSKNGVSVWLNFVCYRKNCNLV